MKKKKYSPLLFVVYFCSLDPVLSTCEDQETQSSAPASRTQEYATQLGYLHLPLSSHRLESISLDPEELGDFKVLGHNVLDLILQECWSNTLSPRDFFSLMLVNRSFAFLLVNSPQVQKRLHDFYFYRLLQDSTQDGVGFDHQTKKGSYLIEFHGSYDQAYQSGLYEGIYAPLSCECASLCIAQSRDTFLSRTTLQLMCPHLKTIPPFLLEKLETECFEAKEGKLVLLPQELFRMRLKALNVSHNQIHNIPQEIGLLSNITCLNVSYNKIRTLPETLFSLTKLTNLYLAHNQLGEMSPRIGCFAQLEYLNFSHNALFSVPAQVGLLTNLRSLRLAGNFLTKLPEELWSLTRLVTLDLSNNPLSEISEKITRLYQLSTLDLYEDQLTQVPKSFSKLVYLRNLSLGGNPLEVIPDQIGHLTHKPGSQEYVKRL